MIRNTILLTFGFLTLMNCQSKKAVKTSTENTTKTETSATQNTTKPKNAEPQMSTGLPPDEEAVKIAQQENANQKKGTMIYLKEGENKFLKEYEMNVTFKQMTADSRCPADVNCIWPGFATAQIEVMGIATRPRILELSTISDQGKDLNHVLVFNGYNLTLVEVTPETSSEKGVKHLKGSYKIGLRIEKSNSADSPKPEVQRGGTTMK